MSFLLFLLSLRLHGCYKNEGEDEKENLLEGRVNNNSFTHKTTEILT